MKNLPRTSHQLSFVGYKPGDSFFEMELALPRLNLMRQAE